MKLAKNEIKDIAHLARLAIEPEEMADYQNDLSEIISFVDQMQAVNTDNIEPIAHPFEASQRLRPDEVTETNQRDKFQAIAPDVERGLFKVPKVIE